jgi:signal recognition particle subunit SEC65
MDHDPDRLVLWPSYFDARRSRRSGRRVAKDASVKKPDLDGLYAAARAVGLRKIKREANVSRPLAPHAKEGRLIVSRAGALEDAGSSSKEEIMQMIGGTWREQRRTAHEAEAKQQASKQQQRSSTKGGSTSKGRSFKRRGFKR